MNKKNIPSDHEILSMLETMSQKDIGKKLKVSQTTISKIAKRNNYKLKKSRLNMSNIKLEYILPYLPCII